MGTDSKNAGDIIRSVYDKVTNSLRTSLGLVSLIEAPSDSSITLKTDDDYTVIFEGTVWDDLKAPATTIRQGATTKPDFDSTELGLLFPQNNPAEVAYIILQFPHDRKNGSNIRPHIHWTQTSALEPVFKMEYRWYKNSDAVPSSWTTLTCDSPVFTYTSGDMLQICSFPEIDGSGIDSVSSIIDIKLYRDDNIVSGDVLLKEFDIHYQKDTIGSSQEFIK